MALWTTNGLNLVATAVQTPSVNAAVTYVGIGTGCGTLASGLTAATPYAALSLNTALPATLAAGAVLTITDGVNVDSATVSSAGALAGAMSIPLTGYTAAWTFAANTTGVCPTPMDTDITLYNEVVRIPANTGVPGANPGESLNQGYFDSTQATNIYMQVGYFGGSTVTSSINTGTLMQEDVQYWDHVLNAGSASFQSDNTI